MWQLQNAPLRPWATVNCHLGSSRLVVALYICFSLTGFFSKHCAQCEARTHYSKIKSFVLYQLSQAGALIALFFTVLLTSY